VLQVATEIWNEILQTQQVRNPLMRRLMRLQGLALPDALDRLARDQESAGASRRATLAFPTVAPLLLENVAISRYVQMKDSSSLREALPEVTTIREAVDLAVAEYSLTATEQRDLRTLLTAAYSPAASES
jgi:hypothetical protein